MSTAYLIGEIIDGAVVDAYMTSEFPLTQVRTIANNKMPIQIILMEASSSDYEAAQLTLFVTLITANISHDWTWLKRMPTLKKQMSEFGRTNPLRSI